MDYSPWSERKFGRFFFLNKKISKTGKALPTKINVLELDINPYMHKFFEPILSN